MIPIVEEKIEDYAARHTDPVPPLVERLQAETREKMEAPQMMVGRLEGQLLKMLVRISGARAVLEIGMFTGYSALMMAEGLPDDGRLVTCDVDPKAEAIARRYFAESPHGGKIEIRMGPALETIDALEGPFDLVFLDADKESYPAYFDAVVPKLRTGGLLVADNVLWSGRVLEEAPESETTRGILAFNEKARSDDRVEKVMLTVRDGMYLLRKR